MTSPALLETSLPTLQLLSRGKVRDIYDLGEQLLIVATDRISAFDSILANGIPDKGRVLTALSKFWFNFTSGLARNHMVTTDLNEMGHGLNQYADQLEGRSMLAKKAKVMPVECVVRGYLAGSGWKDYLAGGTVSGVKLPQGLQQADKLPEPIFTPSSKAESGHDEPITQQQVENIVGSEAAEHIRARSIQAYVKAADYALEHGIIIADTKFEWGVDDNGYIIVDEMLTPDSSRFWDAATYQPGTSPPSFDKQFVRDYLEASGWDKEPPAPALPDDIVDKTRAKYLEALNRLTA